MSKTTAEDSGNQETHGVVVEIHGGQDSYSPLRHPPLRPTLVRCSPRQCPQHMGDRVQCRKFTFQLGNRIQRYPSSEVKKRLKYPKSYIPTRESSPVMFPAPQFENPR